MTYSYLFHGRGAIWKIDHGANRGILPDNHSEAAADLNGDSHVLEKCETLLVAGIAHGKDLDF